MQAQSHEMLVICTYDYKEAIKKQKNCPLKNRFSYLYISVDSNKHYTIKEINSYQEGIARIYKDRNTLVFVHGDGSNIDDLVLRFGQLSALYDVNLILFAWPAQEIKWNGIRNYKQSKKNVSTVFDAFTTTIHDIQNNNQLKQNNITIMFHSLGNLFAKNYAHYIINHLEEPAVFDNIVLNAPSAINGGHELWTDILAIKAKKGVYLNFNENDKMLKIADLFIEHKSLLGQNPELPLANHITYVNFSDILKNYTSYSESHTYFLGEIPSEKAIVKDYFNTILNGKNVDFTDSDSFKKNDLIPVGFDMLNYQMDAVR